MTDLLLSEKRTGNAFRNSISRPFREGLEIFSVVDLYMQLVFMLFNEFTSDNVSISLQFYIIKCNLKFSLCIQTTLLVTGIMYTCSIISLLYFKPFVGHEIYNPNIFQAIGKGCLVGVILTFSASAEVIQIILILGFLAVLLLSYFYYGCYRQVIQLKKSFASSEDSYIPNDDSVIDSIPSSPLVVATFNNPLSSSPRNNNKTLLKSPRNDNIYDGPASVIRSNFKSNDGDGEKECKILDEA